MSPSKRTSAFPVRIIAFRNDKEFSPYKFNEVAWAYYTQSQERDYIVMRDIAGEHYPAAVHEYMHLIIHHSGMKVPLWFDEGWADLFSTLKPIGRKAQVGEMLLGRLQTALREKWIPLATIATVDHSSPLYNEKDRAGMFYAESWALTHMLFLGDNYRPNFGKFVTALGTSPSLDGALQKGYGKSIKEVELDLQQYLRGDRKYAAVFDIKLEKSDETAETAGLTGPDIDLMQADLFAAVNKRAEAKAIYERLSRAGTGNAEVEESLGYMEWRAGDTNAAKARFAKAFELGSKDAKMCYNLAALELQSGTAEKKVIPYLERAVALKPDYLDARLELGMRRMNTGDYGGAIADLGQIKKIDPEAAPRLFLALAYAYTKGGNLDAARKNAELAQKYAHTPEQTSRALELLRYMDARKQDEERPRLVEQVRGSEPVEKPVETTFAPPSPTSRPNPFVRSGEKLERAEGIARQLDCSGNRARLHVDVGGKVQIFSITDPGAVVLKHSGNVTFDFTCGPQKPFKVAVEYVPGADSAARTAGVVKSLEF